MIAIKQFECQNCGKIVMDGEFKPLEEVKNLLLRVAPGEVVPAGECLACGALVHLRSKRQTAKSKEV